jgi:hypothetical protein
MVWVLQVLPTEPADLVVELREREERLRRQELLIVPKDRTGFTDGSHLRVLQTTSEHVVEPKIAPQTSPLMTGYVPVHAIDSSARAPKERKVGLDLAYRGITFCADDFHASSTTNVISYSLPDQQLRLSGPTTPITQRLLAITRNRFGLIPFRSPLLRSGGVMLLLKSWPTDSRPHPLRVVSIM